MAPHSHYCYEESETVNTLQDRQNRQNGSCAFVLQHAQIGRDESAGPQGKGWQEDVAFTLDSRPTSDVVAGCLTPWDAQTKRIHSENGLAPSLASSNSQGGQRVPYVAFAQNTRDELRIQGDGQISGALAAEPGMKQQTYIAFDTTQVTSNGNYSNPQEGDPCHPLASGAHAPAIAFHENKSGQLSEADVLGLRSGASHSYQGVGGNFGVRRLTPRECERLQGFPDDWTRYDSEGKEISDSARYRMLGNAVAVPNAAWLGKRIYERD